MSDKLIYDSSGGHSGNGNGVRKYKTLERWIDEALKDTEKDGKPCSAIAVVYRGNEGRTKEVYTIKLAGKNWDAKTLADIMQGKAETFAQDLGGIQQFELLAFYGDSREPEASHPFRIVDGELRAGGNSRTVRESNDGPGLLAQLMRHVERKDDALIALMGEFAKVTLQREARLLDREEKLQDEVNDAYALVREMIMKQRMDDHAMRMKELEFARSSEERKLLMTKAPALINTIAEREVFPQETADTALIEQLAENIKPEYIDNLVGIGLIKAEIANVLKLRLSKIQEQKAKEQEALAKVPPAAGETIQ